jgi:hypothetical protein
MISCKISYIYRFPCGNNIISDITNDIISGMIRHDIIYDIINDIIHDIMYKRCISHTFLCPELGLKPPIFAQHSVQMKPTTIANLTDQWILTRNVNRHGHGGSLRHSDFIPTVEAHALLR